MPRAAEPDPRLPSLVTSAEAVRAGLTLYQARQRVRSGAWQRVARGAYAPAASQTTADLDEFALARVHHIFRAIAAADRNPGSVIAYESATLVHGLPVLGAVPREVVLAVPPGHWTGRRSGIVFRRLLLPNEHVLSMRVPVTTPARTWVDMACRRTLATALAAGDAGLRSGVLTPRDLAAVLSSVSPLPGLGRAQRAVHLLDPCRETPLESASFAYFVEHRVPLPRVQVVIHDDHGHFIARVDFYWDLARLVGECDGRLKYAEQGSVYKEKLREDALRERGLGVVRWGAPDLRTPELAERLIRRLAP